MKNMHICTAMAGVLAWAVASAHHGVAGFYDPKKLVKIEGVVKEFSWRNPHSGLLVTTGATRR